MPTLGRESIDEEKTRSSEINPKAARFVLLAIEAAATRPQADPLFTI
jgi:hypothetical protein